MIAENLNNRQQRLREAAILVASLDDQMAERLIAGMPEADATEVRLAVEQLDFVEQAEQDEIVAKFRQSTTVQQPSEVAGVELDASLLAKLDEHDIYTAAPAPPATPTIPDSLTEEEATTVVNMLSAEHPQIISIVLSRLNPADAATLLAKFPTESQADILTRMANSDLADEQAVQVIETQLGEWIEQHRQQRQRMAAGLGLVQKILSSTSDTQRKTVLTTLRGQNPDLAGKLSNKPNSVRLAYHTTDQPITEQQESLPQKPTKRQSISKPLARPTPPIAKPSAPEPVRIVSENPARDLDRLDDTTLMATLSQTDRQIVTLALAGASEALMKRVLRGLPRRQASKLRTQLRDIGPTRLSDMFDAQQQLLHNARQVNP